MVRQHHRKLQSHVTKNKLTDKDKMKCSNNNNLCDKYYINLSYIVPVEMESARQFFCPSYANHL